MFKILYSVIEEVKVSFIEVKVNWRVVKELVSGLLKSHWTPLKGIRTQNRAKSQIQHTVDWIQACCTLHNIRIFFNDEWEALVDTSDEDEDRIPVAGSSLEEGKELRRRIHSFM